MRMKSAAVAIFDWSRQNYRHHLPRVKGFQSHSIAAANKINFCVFLQQKLHVVENETVCNFCAAAKFVYDWKS